MADSSILRDLRPGDAGWIIQRHAELYAETQGFDASFEALVARILADFIDTHDGTCERGWIAETTDGTRLGCVLCARHDATTAKLRVLLVEPEARGLGVGRQLVEACIAFARGCGYEGMTLWTQKSLTAACALYAAQGFHLAEERPGRAFGQEAIDQIWRIRF